MMRRLTILAVAAGLLSAASTAQAETGSDLEAAAECPGGLVAVQLGCTTYDGDFCRVYVRYGGSYQCIGPRVA